MLVLILIVVEDGHVRLQLARVYVNMDVLILIVVEDGHVPAQVRVNVESNARLNPYCSGRWSRTVFCWCSSCYARKVLILIVVEDGHVRLCVSSCT